VCVCVCVRARADEMCSVLQCLQVLSSTWCGQSEVDLRTRAKGRARPCKNHDSTKKIHSRREIKKLASVASTGSDGFTMCCGGRWVGGCGKTFLL
jgi:hypothetical protein